ncbi:hypothetical protein LY76DRAFT_642561 [Colletotrichum caudatum]|nr:hypothetical protein LY76DRAFT_642561 [Colletotrichum caudatum]
MAQQRGLENYDAARIRDWIAEEAPETESLVNRLCRRCIPAIKVVLRKTKRNHDVPELAYRSLERSGSSFILWADGHSVVHGNLDDALAKSETLRKSVLELLISIAETISDKMMPLLDPRMEDDDHRAGYLKALVWEAKTVIRDEFQNSDSEESDSDTSSISDLNDWEEIADGMRTDMECLNDLDSIIKCPVTDARKPKAIEYQTEKAKPWTPHRLYFDRIGHRFPGAPLELVQRLAEANWSRFERIQLDKERNITESQKTDGAAGEGSALGNNLTSATEQGSVFHDSGLGTSLATGSAYAETTMSYRQEKQEHSIKIPSLTPEAKKGKPFECMACGRQVKITNNSLWKKHLFKDLRPWICHIIPCQYGPQPFKSREDWTQHLALEHGLVAQWHSIECPLCMESPGHDKVEILKHLSSHFEEISLSSLPAGVASDCDSESVSATSLSGSSQNLSPPESENQSEELRNSAESSMQHQASQGLSKNAALARQQQQQQQQMMDQLRNQGTPVAPAHQIMMDSMDIPPPVLEQLKT